MWVSEQVALAELLVIDSEDYDWEACEEDVVDLKEVDIVDGLAGPAGEPANTDEGHRIDNVLVEVVADHVGVAAVTLPTVI